MTAHFCISSVIKLRFCKQIPASLKRHAPCQTEHPRPAGGAADRRRMRVASIQNNKITSLITLPHRAWQRELRD